MLLIKLNVPTWQTFLWMIVKIINKLVAMQARQIKKYDMNIDEAKAYL